MKKPQSGFLLIPFNKIEPIELIRQNSNETVNSNLTVSIFGTTTVRSRVVIFKAS